MNDFQERKQFLEKYYQEFKSLREINLPRLWMKHCHCSVLHFQKQSRTETIFIKGF